MPAEKALGFMAMLLAYLAIKAGCVAMGVWLEAIAPAFMARVRAAYQSRAKRSFTLGVINGLVLGFLVIVLLNAQFKPLAILGVILLLCVIAGVLIGYMSAYYDVGRRMRGDRDWSATRTLVYGGILAEAAFLAPIIGQVFSLGVLFRGLGAVVSAMLSRGTGDVPID